MSEVPSSDSAFAGPVAPPRGAVHVWHLGAWRVRDLERMDVPNASRPCVATWKQDPKTFGARGGGARTQAD